MRKLPSITRGKNQFLSLIFIAVFLFSTQDMLSQTKRIYFIGNSGTDMVNYDGFEAIAESKGNTHIWGRHMIPGAPMSWIWDHPNDGFSEEPFGRYPSALGDFPWEAITLQPYDRKLDGSDGDVAMASNFINLAKVRNPNVQFYDFEGWPRTPNDKLPTDPSLTADTWSNLWTRTYTGAFDNTQETRDYHEQLVDALRAANTDVPPVLMIPGGEVFYALNDKMKNGLVPGYTKIWNLYVDAGHVNNVGSYVVGCLFYAVIYKADPRGTIVPSDYGIIPANVASVIQQTVWDVVTSYSYTGVNAGTIIPVASVAISPTTLSLNPGQTGQLTATVSPSNATNKTVIWTSSNTAVAIVNGTGLVTATGAGLATITATTADGGKTATTSVTVTPTGGGGGTPVSGVLASWDFQGKGGSSAVTGAAGLPGLSSTLTADLGPGLEPFNYLDNGLTGIDENSLTLQEAITAGEYISFSVAPSAGNTMTINKVNIRPISQNRDRSFTLMSSVNGFAAANAITTFTIAGDFGADIQPVTITGHTNLSGPVEFRLYIYGFDSPYASVGIGNRTQNNDEDFDLNIEGSVTSGSADTQAPTAPAGLTVTNIGPTSINLNWNPSSDNTGVTGYDVFNGSTKINAAIITGTSYEATGLTEGSQYTFTVKAKDAAGNTSTASNAVTVRTNRRPVAVISATPVSGTAPLNVTFSATGSSDPDTGDFILGYEWNFGDGSELDHSVSPTHTYASAGTYTATLRVMDNRDVYSNPVTTNIVVSGAIIPATSVTVNPTTVSLTPGQSSQLTATVLPANATNKAVTWTSADTAVVTVNSSGLVTAIGAGSTTITVTTVSGGRTANVAVTVATGTTISGVLVSWDFQTLGGSAAVTGTAGLSGLSSAAPSRVASIASGFGPFNYLGNGLTGDDGNALTLTDALAQNEYISFSVAPSTGNTITINKVNIRPVSQNRARSFTLMSSVNGFTVANAIATFSYNANFGGELQPVTIAEHANQSSAVEFRLYIYGYDSRYASVGIGNRADNVDEEFDLNIEGSVTGNGLSARMIAEAMPTEDPSSELYITPNPVSSVFKLVMNDDYRGDVVLRIRNTDGNPVGEQRFKKDSKAVMRELNGANLKNGVYFIEIERKGEREVIRMVK